MAEPEAAAVGPASVDIPAIGVRSSLMPLGVASHGGAEVPEDYDRAGWFTGGGASRATVLLGHVDSRSGPAVFHRLRDLAVGDLVHLGRADGSTTSYVVEGSAQFPKEELPTFAVFGASSEDVLRLVTCGGEFDGGARSYTDNLVVFARRT